MRTFEGSMTALATPFREGAFDEAAYRALVRQQLSGGTSALIPVGTTGEAVTLSAEERFRAIRGPGAGGGRRGLQQHLRGD